VTIVYSRMSGFNEVTAIKALGISPTVLLWPTLVVAFLLSLLTAWLNDVAVSWGRRGAQRVAIDAVEEIAYGMLRAERHYTSPRVSINVQDVRGRTLIAPVLSIKARSGDPPSTISAAEAELRSDHRENMLKIILRKGEIDFEDKVTLHFPDVYEQEIPLSDASRIEENSRNPSCLPLRFVPEEAARDIETLRKTSDAFAAQAAFQLICGDFENLTARPWAEYSLAVQDTQKHLCRLRTEPYRRWSAGFSCLCFVWVGAPMAIWLRNRDLLTSFFLCFAPILIVYYPLLAYGIDGAKNGTIPAFSVWTGNVILVVWGYIVLRKVLRY
jgi:lipopolysaccharide export system permease protein